MLSAADLAVGRARPPHLRSRRNLHRRESPPLAPGRNPAMETAAAERVEPVRRRGKELKFPARTNGAAAIRGMIPRDSASPLPCRAVDLLQRRDSRPIHRMRAVIALSIAAIRLRSGAPAARAIASAEGSRRLPRTRRSHPTADSPHSPRPGEFAAFSPKFFKKQAEWG